MHVVAVTAFLFVIALLLAVVEIEAEGKFGWAEKMPTWYRTTGWFAKLYVKLIHKPLTGYHLALAPFTAAIFIWPMVANSNLTWAGIFLAAGQWFVWVTVWDYAWFVLNPRYKAGGFNRHQVWWFAHEKWFGPVPLGYVSNVFASLLFATLGGLIAGDWLRALANQLEQIGWYIFGVTIVVSAAPLFHRYYWAMRRTDDRDKAGISHPSGHTPEGRNLG